VLDGTGYALASVAVGTALLHTLIPDHWLPFVLIGNARRWSVAETLVVSGFAALVHVGLSIALGFAALGLGLERASSVLLLGFGALYAAWALRKGAHFHPGGNRVHLEGQASTPCAGHEGPGHPGHLHYHADEPLIAGRGSAGAFWLALIVGANPCVLILPLILETAGRGTAALVAVCLAYAVPTAVLMTGLSVLGVAGGRRVRLPLAARHMEVGSGLLIAALGLVLLLFDHPR
jgi:nickel/cobalt transporter (NicO) family protein